MIDLVFVGVDVGGYCVTVAGYIKLLAYGYSVGIYLGGAQLALCTCGGNGAAGIG